MIGMTVLSISEKLVRASGILDPVMPHLLGTQGKSGDRPAADAFLANSPSRLGHISSLERVLGERKWLVADRFTVADLLMADVLRVPLVRAFGNRPATEDFVKRATERPAFNKAKASQIALFESGDAVRKAS